MIAEIEPLEKIEDLKKDIRIPQDIFEDFLRRYDWTYHQLARNEFPSPFKDLAEFQLFCISKDPILWIRFFLREPTDPDAKDPYNLWPYQAESIIYPGATIHKCGAATGKSREIVALGLWKAFTVKRGSGLIGAPQQTHLNEIIEGMYDQLLFNPELLKALKRPDGRPGWEKQPHHAFFFSNGFKIFFRPSGHDGEAYRGVHVRTFAIKDEAAKDGHKKQWSEFWRALEPGCVPKIYSVPDGRRDTEFYRLGELAKGTKKEEEVQLESFVGVKPFVSDIKFKFFHWPKTNRPDWTPEQRRDAIAEFGGEDSPGYKHNILGEDGDPENSVFPWEQFRLCMKDIPEFRGLEILRDALNDEVIATGYRCEFVGGDAGIGRDIGLTPRRIILFDTVYPESAFFDLDGNGESDFTRLIKSFFLSVPGLKRGDADFGYTNDPSEIEVVNIVGKMERTIARLQLKHVKYDHQCQALNALDDLYGPKESIFWGTDYGNAGSAVAHDLQGLPQFKHKGYEDRLKGFMFGSTAENIDEEREAIINSKTGKPAKISLKELATDILVKKVQRQEAEFPPDPEYARVYTGHTVRAGDKQRIFKKEDDHLIDARRCGILASLFLEVVEDIFV